MEKVCSGAELYEHIGRMNRENSVSQIYIPGKGTFTIVLQEEDAKSILSEVESDPHLHKMIQDSREAYRAGNSITTSEFLHSMSLDDFAK